MILILTILAFAVGALLGARSVQSTAARPNRGPNRGPNPHRHEWSAFRQGDHARTCPPDLALTCGSVPSPGPAGAATGLWRARPNGAAATGGGRIYLHSEA